MPRNEVCSSPKVLFMVGAGRSGSTLIDQIVGQNRGFRSIGELNAIWMAGLVERERCGCGAAIPDCPFWSAVLTEAFGSSNHIRPHELKALVDEHVRVRPRAMLDMWRQRRQPTRNSPAQEYAAILRRMYTGIASVSGARVIIDSTKLPAHAYAASLSRSIELYLLHVIRDPRAVAYSWLRNPDAGGRRGSNVEFGSMGVVASTAQWTFRGLTIESLLRPRFGPRYMQLRYEDFAAAPAEYAERVIEFLGEESTNPFLFNGDTVQLGDNHIVAGNRSKYRRGAVRVEIDDSWRTEMPLASKIVCTALSWPLIPRYGYALLPSSVAGPAD